MFTLLSHRNFSLLWLGQLISGLGDWLLWIALPFYVYERTGSALATGTMFIVQTLPPILFGILAGIFVDQWDRKQTLVIADLLRFLVVLLLLLAYTLDWLWLIYLVVFVETMIGQFFTPAKNALTPQLVHQEELMRANSLISVGSDLTMLVGPALGGILLNPLGLPGVILLDAGSFLLSGLMIFLIDVSPVHPKVQAAQKGDVSIRTKLWRDWVTGLQFIKAKPSIKALLAIVGIAMLGQGIVSVMWVAFVKEILGGSAVVYGGVQVAVAIGGLLGAVILNRLGPTLTPNYLIALSGMAIGLFLIATFNLPFLPLILMIQFLNGIPAVGFFVTLQTSLQTSTSPDYLGRIFGVYATVNALLMLSGQGLASIFGDYLGIVPLLNLAAGLYFFSGAAALVLLPQRIFEK